jgi:hypothetical protein
VETYEIFLGIVNFLPGRKVLEKFHFRVSQVVVRSDVTTSFVAIRGVGVMDQRNIIPTCNHTKQNGFNFWCFKRIVMDS